jgi:hypothetical protein
MDLLSLSVDKDNQTSIIKRTIETYPEEWVVIHETLQNSIDAIQKSDKQEGEIKITFNLDSAEIEITDNGKGFPFDLKLLGFGGTDKDSQDWNLGGNIGVGLKVVIFSTKKFELLANTKENTFKCNISDAYKYISGEVKSVPLKYENIVEKNADTGTTIKYQFNSDAIYEFIKKVANEYASIVSEDVAKSDLDKFKIALEYYFRSHTYAGNISRLLNAAGNKKVNIKITLLCTPSFDFDKLNAWKLPDVLKQNNKVEINFQNKFWDITESLDRIQGKTSRPALITQDLPEGGRIGNYNTNYIYVKDFINQTDFGRLIKNDIIRDPPSAAAYATLFSQTLGIHIVIGSVETLRKYLIEDSRQFIAASGIPSSHYLIKPSRGGELGYIANIHFVIDLKSKLNYGKQTISNTQLVGLASKFFSDAFRCTLKNVAKAIVGSEPGGTSYVTSSNEDIVNRKDLGLNGISIIKEPTSEVETIALFYELIGASHLKGYETYLISSHDTYDSKMMIKFPNITASNTVDVGRDIKTAEFKFMVKGLVQDFESGKKRAVDISLLIAWDDDYTNTHPDYEVISLTGTEIEDYRLDFVKTCLHYRQTGHKIQILLLKDVIKEIKERQKTTSASTTATAKP